VLSGREVEVDHSGGVVADFVEFSLARLGLLVVLI